MSQKGRNLKIHFTMRDSSFQRGGRRRSRFTHGQKTEPNYPWMFDIENDLKELWDISFTKGWVGLTGGKSLESYQPASQNSRTSSLAPKNRGRESDSGNTAGVEVTRNARALPRSRSGRAYKFWGVQCRGPIQPRVRGIENPGRSPRTRRRRPCGARHSRLTPKRESISTIRNQTKQVAQ
jgi:hypothetical protein